MVTGPKPAIHPSYLSNIFVLTSRSDRIGKVWVNVIAHCMLVLGLHFALCINSNLVLSIDHLHGWLRFLWYGSI